MNTIHPLQAYRQRHNPPLTKAALARKVGVSKTTVARWESGARKVDLELIPTITKETGIPPRELRPDLVEAHEKIFGGR